MQSQSDDEASPSAATPPPPSWLSRRWQYNWLTNLAFILTWYPLLLTNNEKGI